MNRLLLDIAIIIALLPLLGSLIAGFFGKTIGKRATHSTTIGLMTISFALSCYLFKKMVLDGYPTIDGTIYTWISSGAFQFDVSFLLDRLSATMVLVVNFVSLAVHVYTIGYMEEDAGYQRFFSYVSLFTFSMLILILADNFFLMFFGWEGVGLVSYLLIGFWFKRESAIVGSMKAFLANRIGDIGFILAIAGIITYFGNLNYHYVFSNLSRLSGETLTIFPGQHWSVATIICVLLFIGAMGKSAQVPLHVWLPESMEGPTPISALIHAATMVTAGIYMIARTSPIFELSEAALSLVMVVGATTALFLGLLAVFHHDIKRVIAYSTISQLGYMATALGASAYSAAIFHLVTHAFFKALLFLAAGSVIIAFHHHQQDMRKMGGLWRYMPITYVTFLMGSLALAAIPPFSGFYSKDSIIEAVQLSTIPGAGYAYFCVLIGAFVTSVYTFRALFLTFHGPEHFDAETKAHLHESPWVVTAPLIMLAIMSAIVGGILVKFFLFAPQTLLGDSVTVLPQHDVLARLSPEFHGVWPMALDAVTHLTFWLVIAGIIIAWVFNMSFPQLAEYLKKRLSFLYNIMVRKYGFDDFNQLVLVQGTKDLGKNFYEVSDLKMIDGVFVNGSGKVIRWFSRVARKVQSGYLYHYALGMVLGLFLLLSWLLLGH